MIDQSAAAASPLQWLVFDNQPRRNAMNLDMWRQATDELSRHDLDPNVRVLIMRGAGEQAFVSGADISQFETQRNSAEAAVKYAELLSLSRGIHALRIDTHHGNTRMQSALKKNGFTPCGTIYLSWGDPRLAFEKII